VNSHTWPALGRCIRFSSCQRLFLLCAVCATSAVDRSISCTLTTATQSIRPKIVCALLQIALKGQWCGSFLRSGLGRCGRQNYTVVNYGHKRVKSYRFKKELLLNLKLESVNNFSALIKHLYIVYPIYPIQIR
jgi:hypothetical protein